jgi:hypothetical protein
MHIAICRMTFALPGNRSLKGKRQVVRKIVDRLRHKFHAAAGEVGDPEVWSSAEVGFAVLSSNAAHAEGMAQNILGQIEDMMVAPLDDVELEIVAFDDLTQGGSWGEMELWRSKGREKLG